MTHETQRRIEEEADKRYKARTPETPSKFVRIFQKVFEQGATFGYNLANEWVKVSEMLPEFEAWVLCYCGIYGYYIGQYQQILDTNHGQWCDGKESGCLPPIFWLPLPTPPSE